MSNLINSTSVKWIQGFIELNEGDRRLRLLGKVGVVTGGGSGIGRATAVAFAKEGAKVIVADRNETGGKETVETIRKAGGEATFFKADISDATEVRNLVRACVNEYARLDVLANVAGIWEIANVVETSEELWERTININMKGVFLTMKYAIPEMIRTGGGSIINVSSVGGVIAGADEFAYGASKGAVVLMTKGAAVDFGAKNIRVNCVCPAATDTPMTRKWLEGCADPEKELNKFLDPLIAPMRRLIRPEEVANLAVFLASDESPGLTGAIIPVDGGRLAR
jgi:NAD(P)-dependent dehydrogenase (short-subunit alcohol dehydrogenase family)